MTRREMNLNVKIHGLNRLAMIFIFFLRLVIQ